MRPTPVTEPASTAVAGAAAWKLGLVHKLAALVSVGVIGAMMIAAFEPPKTKRTLFAQALAAGVMALLFTPAVVRYAEASLGWAAGASNSVERWAEVALPVAFLVGATSWGLVGALSKLRTILREKAAKAIANRVGLSD